MKSRFALLATLILTIGAVSLGARPGPTTDPSPSLSMPETETIEQLAAALAKAFTFRDLGSLDDKHPYLKRLKVVIEHSITGKRETRSFRSLGAVEKWLRSREHDGGPNRNSGTLERCGKNVCTFEQTGLLHNNLYLQKLAYGRTKGRPYVKTIYVLDGD